MANKKGDQNSEATERLERAFRAVPRHRFLPQELQPLATADYPLPIGWGQTISQPTTVLFMLVWLDVRPGHRVLDVGSGSGWSSALLAHLSGPGGKVEAVERISELLAFGQRNVKELGFKNVSFHLAGETVGWPAAAPYDRILVSASAPRLPADLLHQLRPGGKAVVPVGNDIAEVSDTPDGLQITRHPGFLFVPLVGAGS